MSRETNGFEYLYGPEFQRIRQVVTTPKETATTYYLNGADSLGLTYEREQTSGGTIEHRHYLSAVAMFSGSTSALARAAVSARSTSRPRPTAPGVRESELRR